MPIATILCLLWNSSTLAQDGRWVMFKTGHDSRGRLEHQIDRNSIRQDGRFKTFWTRIWIVREHQALVFSTNEQLFFWSQKFLVDCVGRRFGSDFIDSNQPGERKRRAREPTMHWQSLDQVAAVAHTVCGEK